MLGARKKPLLPMLCLACAPARPQTWTWPGCPDVANADFSFTYIARRGAAPDPGLIEPIKMDFDMDAQGNVDIY